MEALAAKYAAEGGDAMDVVIELGLTTGVFTVECCFDHQEASHNDHVGVSVVVTSHFPVPVTCRLPQASFSASKYDATLHAEAEVEAELRQSTHVFEGIFFVFSP